MTAHSVSSNKQGFLTKYTAFGISIN